MSFRFVHTADLHLDAPLRAIALRDPDLAQQLGVASRTAFSRIVDLCIDEQVAFLLIAGDLWDGAHSSTKTPRFLKQELLRLEAAGITVRKEVLRAQPEAVLSDALLQPGVHECPCAPQVQAQFRRFFDETRCRG